jgi:UDP-GlcNAc3NAcA epimerase
MLRIATILGARPQFIKAAAVSRAIARHGGIEERIVHTGQHFDAAMSDVFFEELEIPKPAHALGIQGGGQGDMTGRMMVALEPVVAREKPDLVLIYGDTNSTLAGALVAAKLHIPVAHVEAGLRSFNRAMPEEINRVVSDHLSQWLFCPSDAAIANLAREGLTAGVHAVGDVMFDTTLFAAERARARSRILETLDLAPGTYAVATIHRAENTDDPAQLARVMDWLKARATERPVVMPLHPRTRKAAEAAGLSLAGLRFVEPLPYFDMAWLTANAVEVFTDSGGLQKEAYFHRKPCTTLRAETEWVETIEAGWNRLWTEERRAPLRDIAEYGDGHAADRIVALLAG